MGGSKSPSTVTNVNEQKRPEYIDQAFQSRYLPGVYAAYERGYTPYQGQRIADLNPSIQGAMQMTQARAVNGSPVNNAALGMATDTLNGRYLDPTKNPIWDSMAGGIIDKYKTGVAAQTDSAFARANAFGGSAYNEATQRNQQALGGALAGAAGNLYNQERGYQMQAAGMAPQLGQQDYRDAEALLGVGDIQRQYQQDLLNQSMQDYYDQVNYPVSQLDMLGRGLTTAMTGSQSSLATGPNPYRPNPTAGALGGALAGAGAGATLGPWGALGGAVVGGLGGYYGSR